MSKFIPRSTFPSYNIPLSSFKGHHQKALSKLGHLSPQLDLIIEVRDCRAPIASTNALFDKLLATKRKLILYSKKDLSILKPNLLDKWHAFNNETYMFIDCRNRNDCKRLINTIRNIYENLESKPPLGLRSMIIGMPNVGKSTLVNTLRQVGLENDKASISTKIKKVAKTGGQPGVTRSTSEIIRLSNDPEIMVYDTPGISLPTVKDSGTMLTLGLVGCIHDSFIDPVILADYLLYLLNFQDPSGKLYSDYMSHPTNDIYELMYNIAKHRNTLRPNGTYDELGVATHWINLWKQGKSKKYRGLFDLSAIQDINEENWKEINNLERERVGSMKVHQKLVDSFGSNGASKTFNRKRTAKDRDADMKNRMFKL
ncbi:mtg1 [Candida pseudojiufengensis]|uniref:mtg1 n=1 Tax=Candida pseudojiufengensis TaxID=497109 RepID=UPI00222492A7|nr:mtg1 [Candida pseudojiufengensis]KAI5963603.1 mtg1 [Candida pseudojiufengensis]